MPAALPSLLQKPDYKFKANQKRAMTGQELVEYQEREVIRANKQKAREAKFVRKEQEDLEKGIP